MAEQIALESFTKELFESLDETFEQTHGRYLDRGTSLFTTLDQISAAEASQPIASGCASIAAHVEHVRFYLDVLFDIMQKEEVTKVNWREIWETVREVTPQEWEASRQRLRDSYQRTLDFLKNYDRWQGEYGISGSLAVLSHSAYHLGAIRQAWCALKSHKQES